MIQLTDYQRQTANTLLHHSSKKAPIVGARLAIEIRLKTGRNSKEGADIRSIVNALRVKGIPICASGNGYYYAENEAELEEYVEQLKARVEAQQAAIAGLEKAAGNVREKRRQQNDSKK